MPKKRIQVSIGDEYFEKLNRFTRYGYTYNDIAAYILCKYLDDREKKMEIRESEK